MGLSFPIWESGSPMCLALRPQVPFRFSSPHHPAPWFWTIPGSPSFYTRIASLCLILRALSATP